MDKPTRQRRLQKLMDLLKSWKGPKPDYDHPDYSRWHQTEEEYQAQQQQWLQSRKKKPK